MARKDPDEMEPNEPSHQDLHCLPLFFTTLFAILFSTFVYGTSVIEAMTHSISWKSSLLKHRCERVKVIMTQDGITRTAP